MKIVDVNDTNYQSCLMFLNKIKSLDSIDVEILKNASIIIDDNDEILGILSYEKFASYGLIRYFVYKKNLDDQILLDLFNHLKEKVKKENIKTLISLVLRTDVIDVFKKFGFSEANRHYFFIEETNILNTNFNNAYILTINLQ